MNRTHNSPFLSPYEPTRRQMLAGTGGLAVATTAGVRTGHPLVAAAHRDLQATPVLRPEAVPMQAVLSFEAQFTGIVVIGMTPRGIRFDIPYAGEVITGPLEGATVQGTDYLVIRTDGVGVLDVRALVVIREGHTVSIRATGYFVMPEGVELPLDLIADPGFVWPDQDAPLHGFGLFETSVADLAWLNRTALAAIGTVNPGTGALAATYYAFTPIPGLTSG